MTYFRRGTTNSNKYGRYHLNNGKFGGMKWKNVTLQEMLPFYGVMFWMSIDHHHLGGYTSYFE